MRRAGRVRPGANGPHAATRERPHAATRERPRRPVSTLALARGPRDRVDRHNRAARAGVRLPVGPADGGAGRAQLDAAQGQAGDAPPAHDHRARRRARPARDRGGGIDCRVAMPGRPRKSLLLALALLAPIGLAGCGDAHTKVTTGTYAGESGANAPYLNVGPLTYEVQLSRQLSPFDTEDAAYLQGLSAMPRALTPEQEWFAVFLQVFNTSSKSEPAASKVTITDTQGK